MLFKSTMLANYGPVKRLKNNADKARTYIVIEQKDKKVERLLAITDKGQFLPEPIAENTETYCSSHQILEGELKLAKFKLIHPNIARIIDYDLGSIDTKALLDRCSLDAAYHDKFTVISEVRDGIDLFSYLKTVSPLTENLVAQLMRQLLTTMSFAVDLGFAHRNLSSDCIMI
jgi:serine/threonine protein kinase